MSLIQRDMIDDIQELCDLLYKRYYDISISVRRIIDHEYVFCLCRGDISMDHIFDLSVVDDIRHMISYSMIESLGPQLIIMIDGFNFVCVHIKENTNKAILYSKHENKYIREYCQKVLRGKT